MNSAVKSSIDDGKSEYQGFCTATLTFGSIQSVHLTGAD